MCPTSKAKLRYFYFIVTISKARRRRRNVHILTRETRRRGNIPNRPLWNRTKQYSPFPKHWKTFKNAYQPIVFAVNQGVYVHSKLSAPFSGCEYEYFGTLPISTPPQALDFQEIIEALLKELSDASSTPTERFWDQRFAKKAMTRLEKTTVWNLIAWV